MDTMRKTLEYAGMRHRYDVAALVLDAALRRGRTYPGMPPAGGDRWPDGTGLYEGMPESAPLRTETTAGGTPIRRQDAEGRWYFMPVSVRSSLRGGAEIELPCAAISISGRKRIVQTALTGRRGTVNELVSIEGYEVRITAALIGEGGDYPEDGVQQMRELWEQNEAVELISAVTDLVVGKDDRFVFDRVEFPAMGGVEHVQIVKFSAHTDAAVELVIE